MTACQDFPPTGVFLFSALGKRAAENILHRLSKQISVLLHPIPGQRAKIALRIDGR